MQIGKKKLNYLCWQISWLSMLKISKNQQQQQKTPGTIMSMGYSKVLGVKVNIQKSVALLYASNRQLVFEIRTAIPFTLAPKNVILGYKSKKNIQALCEEKCKSLMKEIEEDLNKVLER